MSQNQTRTLILASLACLCVMAAPAARAQKTPDLPQPALPLADPSEIIDNKNIEKRLQREEKALRDLRQIVLKAQAQGNPVAVKLDGPDPQITDLQSRLGDLEETLRRQTGQVEAMTHDAAVATKAAADANDAAKALAARLDAVEKQLAAAQAAAAPPPAALGAPGVVGAGPGVLGTLSGTAGPPPADQPDEPGAYRQARKMLDGGDYVGAAQALQDYLQRYPDSPRAQEANYWLGRTLALRNMHADAAPAYARSLKGWPQTSWAGDALVRMAASLVELKEPAKACKALEEYQARYGAKAPPALQLRARETRTLAAC